MKTRSILFLIIVLLAGIHSLAAQTGLSGSGAGKSSYEIALGNLQALRSRQVPMYFIPVATYAQAALSDEKQEIPANIRNNEFFIESVRLTNLAQEAFEYGDYDASVNYSAEALKYAQMSDEYVALQLKIKEANDAIAAARERLDWAESIDAAARYRDEMDRARGSLNEALAAQQAERWDDAINAASRVLVSLADVKEAPPVPVAVAPPPIVVTPPPVLPRSPAPAPVAPPPAAVITPPPVAVVPPPAAVITPPPVLPRNPAPVPVAAPPVEQPKPAKIPLPAMYTVRPWALSKDCFWNIAGRGWAYNDSTKWQVIYNANKAKLANPNNPDLLHADIVLDIPSIRGEVREGMWDPTKAYEPLGR
ncbi:MAG: hypothetical protein LBP76_01765 [Treponema sp.]|jgi:hypothetical protein|nr:hypothetical protein [Treponema sp.]